MDLSRGSLKSQLGTGNRWLDIAVAAGGGALWAACFTETERTVLPWIALAPLLWLLGRPRATRLAWLHGTVAWLVAIPWIVPTLVVFGDIPRPLAIVLLAGLAAYLGAYHAAFAWLGRRLWRRGGAAILALPGLWCLLEVARSWLISGFPWNLAGSAWIAVPGALALMAWIGVGGVSCVLVFANAGIARAIERRHWEPAAASVLAALLLLAFGARWAGPQPERNGSPVPVRLLQPNTPILDGTDRAAILAAHQKMLRLTIEACDESGALVVWPESAGWPFILERDADFRADVLGLAARGCGILLNSPRFDGDVVYNTAFLVDRGGATTHYDKRHLVPFGEYVPLQSVLPFVGTLARNAGSFAAADHIALLRYGPVALGLAVCFEVTFPVEVAALAREGATALGTLTNDAWYGDSAAPWQHLRAARMRAAENHRTMLRAALTGVSAWIEPDGSMSSMLDVGEEGILRGDLVPRRELTLYARAPWAVPTASLVLFGGVFSFVIFDRRRSRS